jgi:hypothetical protein
LARGFTHWLKHIIYRIIKTPQQQKACWLDREFSKLIYFFAGKNKEPNRPKELSIDIIDVLIIDPITASRKASVINGG